MKKYIAILLCLGLLLSLAGCTGDEGNADQQITRGPDKTDPGQSQTQGPDATTQGDNGPAVYSFAAHGVTLVPGADFDPTVLPQPESTYEVPSCAIEGTDLVYNYGTFEVTAFRGSQGDVIYSVYLLDPNTATAEGLLLGDPQSRVTELYGEGYTAQGTSWVYTKGQTMLIILFQDGNVLSIEYRMVTQ